jgi:tetratricopeptide (TPR) repeat protein
MMEVLPPMASVFRTIGLAVLVAVAPGAAWAGSRLSGSYQAGLWGRVELSLTQERLVVHTAGEGGACGFEPRFPVLEGELQGNVLVGELTVCLRGDACPAVDRLPVLAFYGPADGTLTAYVRPREGCQAPELGPGGLLVLRPAPEEAEGPTGGVVRAGGSTLARLRTERRNPEAAKESLEKGNKLLGAKDWSGSATEFERSITQDDRNWVAFFGLGTAQLMRGQARDAIEALDRARVLNAREPSIHYHLACAHSRLGDKRKAMDSLRQAVKLGFAIPEGSFQDVELDRFLGSEPEYLGLTNQAIQNYKAPAGRRQPTGP